VTWSFLGLRWGAGGRREIGASLVPWSDEPDSGLNRAAVEALEVRVVPAARQPTEIVLEGKCPRCLHQTASTHSVRTLISDEEARRLAAGDGFSPPEGAALRRVSAQCDCRHEHPQTPAGEHGCGAPFALWAAWSREVGESGDRVVTTAAALRTSPLEVREERALEASARTQLADVRKAAESWRTGLAGFLAILVAIFFIKGKSSFDDISGTGWRVGLAVLLLLAAACALFGGYRALRAAYGTPRDEFLGEVPKLFRYLPETTPRHIHEYGTVSAWRYAFARQAVNDLRLAKVATIASLGAVACAAVVTWFAPGPPSSALVRATYRDGRTTSSICGEVVRSSGGRLVVRDSQGLQKDLRLSDVDSMHLVRSCD
jgi:hypothetical protein